MESPSSKLSLESSLIESPGRNKLKYIGEFSLRPESINKTENNSPEEDSGRDVSKERKNFKISKFKGSKTKTADISREESPSRRLPCQEVQPTTTTNPVIPTMTSLNDRILNKKASFQFEIYSHINNVYHPNFEFDRFKNFLFSWPLKNKQLFQKFLGEIKDEVDMIKFITVKEPCPPKVSLVKLDKSSRL